MAQLQDIFRVCCRRPILQPMRNRDTWKLEVQQRRFELELELEASHFSVESESESCFVFVSPRPVARAE